MELGELSAPPLKKGTDARIDFTVERNVLRNNYQSRNLIGHYPFWVISPRNLTSFTDRFSPGGARGRGTRLVHPKLLPSAGITHAWGKSLAPFPGLPRLQFLIAAVCILQLKRSKTGAGEGLGTRLGSPYAELYFSHVHS